MSDSNALHAEAVLQTDIVGTWPLGSGETSGLQHQPTDVVKATQAASRIGLTWLHHNEDITLLTHRVLAAVAHGWVPHLVPESVSTPHDDLSDIALPPETKPAADHVEIVIRDDVGDHLLRVTVAGEHPSVYGVQPAIRSHIWYDDSSPDLVLESAGRYRATTPDELEYLIEQTTTAIQLVRDALHERDRPRDCYFATVETVAYEDSPLRFEAWTMP